MTPGPTLSHRCVVIHEDDVAISTHLEISTQSNRNTLTSAPMSMRFLGPLRSPNGCGNMAWRLSDSGKSATACERVGRTEARD